ncbi:RING-H2 finger protein ATL22-like isoform X2 [Cucumis melo]|uniref:RING-type E3 ubiquitin transferase n=1 Tax=Cucumis melo TaxID=3656 RepID=A0ABM3KYT2_CUCME|nr:RING-H2 finger protein ATL22-like isoform X2 [Cucumis melo]
MILLLLFFSFFNLATTSELCFDSHCTGDYQTIRFPFRIVNGQPKSCGYPGFDLSCHPTGANQLVKDVNSNPIQAMEFNVQTLKVDQELVPMLCL